MDVKRKKPARGKSDARGTAGVADGERVTDRIVRAAYDCFERFGISKTTIEDIAEGAGVSRPTVYKYFNSKEDIVEKISLMEGFKVTMELRRSMTRHSKLEDLVTECLVFVVRQSQKNVYIRRMIENVEFLAQVTKAHSPFNQRQMEWWGPLLEAAFAKGEIASDLSLDDVVSWLTLATVAIQIRVEATQITDNELRKFIKRFFVLPLMASPSR